MAIDKVIEKIDVNDILGSNQKNDHRNSKTEYWCPEEVKMAWYNNKCKKAIRKRQKINEKR
ncbi:Hypothetical protein CINCED_3A004573 [Cinara cedri]|uniref:Uncharacterized protein n=1 Tax=Cinara cedri TaxID=506608 RepID=A0A5E4N5D2_9HEMI|nr:Hypothetical protein CINCED_3A004573 [Cinara cedri]